MKDQEVQTDLTSAKIKELEETISKQFEQLQIKDEEVAELKRKLSEKGNQVKELEVERDNLRKEYNQIRINVSNILCSEIEGTILAKSDKELINQTEAIIKKLSGLKAELAKEKGWWDKWVENGIGYYDLHNATNMGPIKGGSFLDYLEKKHAFNPKLIIDSVNIAKLLKEQKEEWAWEPESVWSVSYFEIGLKGRGKIITKEFSEKYCKEFNRANCELLKITLQYLRERNNW